MYNRLCSTVKAQRTTKPVMDIVPDVSIYSNYRTFDTPNRTCIVASTLTCISFVFYADTERKIPSCCQISRPSQSAYFVRRCIECINIYYRSLFNTSPLTMNTTNQHLSVPGAANRRTVTIVQSWRDRCRQPHTTTLRASISRITSPALIPRLPHPLRRMSAERAGDRRRFGGG